MTRLAHKLLDAEKHKPIDQNSVMEILCSGEGHCNTIPFGNPGPLREVMIVNAIQSTYPIFLKRKPSAVSCLKNLLKDIKARANKHGPKLRVIKIALDRIDPEIHKTLIEIYDLVKEDSVDFEVDLISSTDMRPVRLEEHLFNQRIPASCFKAG